jgi:hypothetical protein
MLASDSTESAQSLALRAYAEILSEFAQFSVSGIVPERFKQESE